MVESILQGRKTMTRRIVKPGRDQDWLGPETLLKSPSAYPCMIDGQQWAQFRHPLAGKFAMGVQNSEDSPLTCIKCPYGKPRDILYVRETWANLGHNNCQDGAEQRNLVVFKASENGKDWESNTEGWRWKPGIHLKKEDSRIWLQVEDITVERLQDISQKDAREEGVYPAPHRPFSNDCIKHEDNSLNRDCYFCTFKMLWNKINGEKMPWHKNPWVWVVKFKVLSTTGKPDSIPEINSAIATETK